MQESVEGCGVVQTRLSHILLQHIIHQVRCLPSPSPPPAVLSFTSSFNNLNIDLDRSPSPSVVFHSYLVEAVTSYIRSAYVFLSPLSSLSLFFPSTTPTHSFLPSSFTPHSSPPLSLHTSFMYIFLHSPHRAGNVFEKQLVSKLRGVMLHEDLEEVTSRQLREKLEKEMDMGLTEYREFLDRHMLRILGQLEQPSKILDYLYLVCGGGRKRGREEMEREGEGGEEEGRRCERRAEDWRWKEREREGKKERKRKREGE